MGGRPRQPTALHILKGSYEKDPQRQNKQEPKPAVKRPVMPRGLDYQGKAAWNRIAEQLEKMRVLTEADGDALAEYAKLYSRWIKADKAIDKHGISLVKIDNLGNQIRYANPECAEFHRCQAAMIKILIEFGMTPASRTRIQVQSAEPGSTAEKKKKFLA